MISPTADPGATTSPGASRSSTVRRVLIAAAVLLLIVLGIGRCAFPGDSLEDGEGIAGTYVVNGIDPLGTEYAGTVRIQTTDDTSTYTVEWLITGTIQTGTGTLNGSTFTVEWESVSSPSGDESGTAVYEIDDEGVLRGERFVDGYDEAGTEEIFPEP